MRLALLDAAGFWRDEVSSTLVAEWPLRDLLFARFGEARNQPPLSFLLIKGAHALLDPLGLLSPEAVARLPSALAGAGACLLLAGFSRALGRAACALGALLLATSFGYLSQSVEARPYALLTCWALLALLALLRALEGGRRAGRWWALVALAGLAGLATSYLMVSAILPGLALVAAWRLWPVARVATRGADVAAARRRLRPAGLAALALAGGMALAVPEMLRLQWAGHSLPDNPADAVVKLLLYNGLSFGPAPGPVWAAGLSALAAGGVIVGLRAGAAARQTMAALLTVGGWGLAALALSAPSELVAPRYWSFSYPLLCLAAGAGLVAMAQRLAAIARRRAGVALVGPALLALSGAPAVLMALAAQEAPPGAPPRPDYRAAARLLAAQARPGDTVGILTDPEHGWRVSDWYWRHGAPLAAGVAVLDFADPRLDAAAQAGRIYWLVAANDAGFTQALGAAPPAGLSMVAVLPRAIILRDDAAAPRPLAGRLAAVAGALAGAVPNTAPLHALDVARGTAREAVGDAAGAAAWFRQAGAFRALGLEHLAGAAGFLARGERDRTLIDLAAARALEPGSAAIHATAADLLDQAGYPAAAARERAVAAVLGSVHATGATGAAEVAALRPSGRDRCH